MDENSGMAFVLISHLSSNHESLLSELLAEETQMSVMQVREETSIQPNCVYVIPPDADLTIDRGILYLFEPLEARHRSPIDVFFRSLAENKRENAVCVILSGTGSDGTAGLKAIKENSGLAIAQDSKTAGYDKMIISQDISPLNSYKYGDRKSEGGIKVVRQLEELETSNEELLSMNEELQTSKEETYSINKELETVNGELRSKNAIKFSYPNGRITVSMAIENERVMVEIADTGIGIEEKALSRIFIPFS